MSVCLSVRPYGEVSRHLPENALREWHEILHAGASWPPSELTALWSRSVDFRSFGAILTQWNGSNLGIPGISQIRHGGNGLKFCMLMYLDHLQNCLVYGYGLLIFLILALFWLSKTVLVKFVVSGHFLENAWREWPEILSADVSWPYSELISLWSWSDNFSHFGTILT